MAKVLISGGSGLFGKELSARLLLMGHEPLWLSRFPGRKNGIKRFAWDTTKQVLDMHALEDVRHIVHLAGANVMKKRWTNKYRHEILQSRLQGAQLLAECLRRSSKHLEVFVGASATGYYGTEITEHSFGETD